jgi:hypothetical protein
MFWRPWLRSLQCIYSPCNLSVRDCTEVFCTIYKWDVPSAQCKTRLRGPSPTREIVRLSLVSIDSDVPVLTPRSHWSETALQLSENIALFAVCGVDTCVISKRRDSAEPCGTSACISLGGDISPSTETLNFLFERNELISLIIPIENSNVDNLYSKPGCHSSARWCAL